MTSYMQAQKMDTEEGEWAWGRVGADVGWRVLFRRFPPTCMTCACKSSGLRVACSSPSIEFPGLRACFLQPFNCVPIPATVAHLCTRQPPALLCSGPDGGGGVRRRGRGQRAGSQEGRRQGQEAEAAGIAGSSCGGSQLNSVVPSVPAPFCPDLSFTDFSIAPTLLRPPAQLTWLHTLIIKSIVLGECDGREA